MRAIDPAACLPHNRLALVFTSAACECTFVSPESEKKRNPKFERVGQRVDEEIEEFLRWFNDEAVPSIRRHSSRTLRKAAVKLTEFANYMDDLKKQQ